MGQQPLRSQALNSLRSALLDGRIEPGAQIRLAPLAEQLSISPTPAREALALLETEGLVVLRPNRGYFAAPLTVGEAQAIYPLLGALEALAVRFQGGVRPEQLDEMVRINTAMANATTPHEAYELDRSWHACLIRECTNGLLLEQLQMLRRLAERYERAYMRHSGRIPTSTEQHGGIIDALRRGSADVAEMVAHHWQLSLEFVHDWLAHR